MTLTDAVRTVEDMTSTVVRGDVADWRHVHDRPPRPPSPASRPVAGTATVHRLLYLVSAVPLGALWLALVVTGWVLTVVLAITPLLPAVLIGFAAAVRFSVWVEGHLARRLLGAPTRPRRLTDVHRRYWASVPGVLGDGRFWRGLVFLLLRCVLGLVTAILVLAVLGAGLEGVLAPLLSRIIPVDDTHGIDLGFWLVDTLGESLLLVPVGLVVLAIAFALLHGCARMWRRLAVAMLTEGDEDV
jgi:hypothetical protein